MELHIMLKYDFNTKQIIMLRDAVNHKIWKRVTVDGLQLILIVVRKSTSPS